MPFEDVEGVDTTESELLVVNVASPTEGGYDRGDVVVVRPHKWPWARLEEPESRRRAFEAGVSAADPPDKFVILKINGRDFETARGLGRPHSSEPDPETGDRFLLSKSQFQIDLDALPRPVKEDLANNGRASISAAQLDRATIDKDAG